MAPQNPRPCSREAAGHMSRPGCRLGWRTGVSALNCHSAICAALIHTASVGWGGGAACSALSALNAEWRCVTMPGRTLRSDALCMCVPRLAGSHTAGLFTCLLVCCWVRRWPEALLRSLASWAWVTRRSPETSTRLARPTSKHERSGARSCPPSRSIQSQQAKPTPKRCLYGAAVVHESRRRVRTADS